MIPITHADGRAEQKLLRQLKARSGEVDRKVTAAVTAILDNVRQNGDRAVENYTLQFDGQMPEHILVERPEMEAALDQCDSKFVYALYQAAANIRDFHERQKRQSFLNTLDNGVILGQRVRGLKRVGLYVPGGTAAHRRHVWRCGSSWRWRVLRQGSEQGGSFRCLCGALGGQEHCGGRSGPQG